MVLFSAIIPYLSKFKDFIKLIITKSDGTKEEVSIDNLGNSTIINNGEMNVVNYNFIINGEKIKDNFGPQELSKLNEEIINEVSNHKGAISFENENVETVKLLEDYKLTEIQKNQIKMFKDAGWKNNKIISIKIAYKIVNAEDNGKCEEAKKIMSAAFNGRKASINKKLYNLARSNYLETIAFDLLFSSNFQGDERIDSLLNYLPDAIFMDDNFNEYILREELNRRENEGIKRITVYARGNMRKSMLEKSYKFYIFVKKEHRDSDKFYKRSEKVDYKICDDNCQRIDLILYEINGNSEILDKIIEGLDTLIS